MAGHTLLIGLLAYNTMQHRALGAVVENSGHSSGPCLLISQLCKSTENATEGLAAIDAWVVNIDGAQTSTSTQDDDALDSWLDAQTVPVIVCDGAIPGLHEIEYRAWARRLLNKLNQLSGTINLAQAKEGSAHQVWVLAASTGGPAAVKQFMSELPPKLEIGFIYVQHIDAGFDGTLLQVMNRHTHYPASLANHGDVILPNRLAIVSPQKMTEVLPNGTFSVKDEPWSTTYTPSVDSIVSDVAYSYGERAGVIIFTGMGDDGAASCRLIRRNGGKVWVETPSSCTSTAMPEAALATGCVDFKGSPFSLAKRIVQSVQTSRYLHTSQHASGGLH